MGDWSDDDEWGGDDPSSKQAPVPAAKRAPAAKKETPAEAKKAADEAKKAADEADWDDDDWEAPPVPEAPKEKTVGKAAPKPEEGKGKGKGKKGKKGKGKAEEENKAPAMPGDCYVCGKQLDQHPSKKYCSAAPKPMTKEEYWAKENAKTFAALGGDDEWDDDA